MEGTTGDSSIRTTAIAVALLLCVYVSCHGAEFQLCYMCSGSVGDGSTVANFCVPSFGYVDGRCCLRNNSNEVVIIGLDISNCSLSHLEDIPDASTAVMIDLSMNPISGLNDSVFQGFYHLNNLILPSQLSCPGGNMSWETVEVRGNSRFCVEQKNTCNHTGHMSWDCPENSLCMPYGPGFFECSCFGDFHGYKCMREGKFPTLRVFGILGGSTVLVSALLWFTQRRKAKAI